MKFSFWWTIIFLCICRQKFPIQKHIFAQNEYFKDYSILIATDIVLFRTCRFSALAKHIIVTFSRVEIITLNIYVKGQWTLPSEASVRTNPIIFGATNSPNILLYSNMQGSFFLSISSSLIVNYTYILLLTLFPYLQGQRDRSLKGTLYSVALK